MADVREREAYLVPNKNALLYRTGKAQDPANKIRIIISDKNRRRRYARMLVPKFCSRGKAWRFPMVDGYCHGSGWVLACSHPPPRVSYMTQI
jgi:hypothetical protein